VTLVRRPFAVVAVAVVALVATACSGGASGHTRRGATTTRPTPAAPAPTTDARPTIDWHACDGGECGTLSAPLDYAHPERGQVSLALLRVKARDPSRRVGSLLLNPGGPGGSGVDFLRDFVARVPSELRDRFDLVSWDPRGTGTSTSVQCGTDLDYLFAADTSPDTPAEEQALEVASKRFADACEQGSAALLPFISSDATARDMDRIREAVGDRKLTYLGYSYGTYLGTIYAHDFPGNVRALVLDGAIDPAVPPAETTIQQAEGFEHALDDFFAWCATTRSCAFRSGGNPSAAYDALARDVDAHPLTTRVDGERRVLGPTEFDLAVSTPLYGGRPAWPILADALAHARNGDGSDLLRLFDEQVERQTGGRYGDQYPAFLAISCLDGPSIGDVTTLRALEQTAAERAPRFGASNVGLGMACAFWPVPAVNRPGAITAPGAPPIVVIGTTGDPATPIDWARGLASELGSGRLLIYRGEGHTAFPADDECLDPAVIRYLVDLRVPPDGTTCP
jgi:pimeloyl-ACP methyl ester carboxylesterase